MTCPDCQERLYVLQTRDLEPYILRERQCLNGHYYETIETRIKGTMKSKIRGPYKKRSDREPARIARLRV